MLRAEPIRALMIGAHPDDCEWKTGGLATKYRALGHIVKYVSITSGSAGHHSMDPQSLAARRLTETRRVAEETGIEYEVFDIPDGQVQPDIPTRERIISLIRNFKPDLIFTHRPNDYHPDHRITGTLVMDASFLIRVPLICPNVACMTKTPVILYMYDTFQKPIPLSADIVIGIDDELRAKVSMLHCHTSQFYEWLPWIGVYAGEIPENDEERLQWQYNTTEARDRALADKYRAEIVRRYGESVGKAVSCVEVFEISEYGRALPPDEIDDWFPL